MKFRKAAIGIGALLTVGGLYFASFGFRKARNEGLARRIQDLRRLTEQSVPLGASSEQVILFLDAQHLDHSELMKSEMMHISGHEYANKNVVLAIKRHTHSTLLIREDIQLVFVFDDDKKLKAIDLVPIYTGP